LLVAVLACLSQPAWPDTELGNWMPDTVPPQEAEQRPRTAYTPLEFARIQQTANDVDPEFAYGSQRTLIEAARRGDPGQLDRLLKRGVNPNAKPDLTGNTALMWAIDRDDVVMVRRLLDAGADPDELAGYFTPLGRAALLGYDQIVALLLKHGANPDLKSKDGSTPLIAAAGMGRLAAVRALVAAKPDYTLFDGHGQTALGVAAVMGHIDIVRILLEAGVDPNLPNKFGATTLSMVGGPGHEALQSLLVKYGAESR
jgi:ankyrin repeat protein